MDEAKMEALAKALLEKLLRGEDVIEVKAVVRDGERAWRIRMLPPD